MHPHVPALLSIILLMPLPASVVAESAKDAAPVAAADSLKTLAVRWAAAFVKGDTAQAIAWAKVPFLWDRRVLASAEDFAAAMADSVSDPDHIGLKVEADLASVSTDQLPAAELEAYARQLGARPVVVTIPVSSARHGRVGHVHILIIPASAGAEMRVAGFRD